jgi:lipoprotein Spr
MFVGSGNFPSLTPVGSGASTQYVQAVGSPYVKDAPNGKVVGVLKRGTRAPLIEKHNNWWYAIEFEGKKRYVTTLTRYTKLAGTPQEAKETAPNDSPIVGEKPIQGDWEAVADKVIAEGMKLYGKGKTEYVYGAERYIFSNGRRNPDFDIDEFDCSSFTQYIFAKHGFTLKSASRSQFLGDGYFVNRDQLRKGDLVFFSTSGTDDKYEKGDYRSNGHVGIVKEVKPNGDVVVLHTYSPKSDVTTTTMYANNTGWWNQHYLYAKRVIADNGTEAKDVIIDKDKDLTAYVNKDYRYGK